MTLQLHTCTETLGHGRCARHHPPLLPNAERNSPRLPFKKHLVFFYKSLVLAGGRRMVYCLGCGSCRHAVPSPATPVNVHGSLKRKEHLVWGSPTTSFVHGILVSWDVC